MKLIEDLKKIITDAKRIEDIAKVKANEKKRIESLEKAATDALLAFNKQYPNGDIQAFVLGWKACELENKRKSNLGW